MLIAMARVHSVIPGLALIRPAIIVAAIALVLFIFDGLRTRAIHHLKHPLSWLALLFLFWAALGAPFGLYPGKSIRFLFGDFLRVIIFFILVAAVVRNLHDVRRLLMTIAFGAMVFSLFAALPAGFKAVGGGGYDPNDSAMFIAAAFPLAVYFTVQERRLALKVLFALGLLVCTVAIVRTGSRGGFLAFGAVIVYIVLFFQALKPIYRVLTVAAVLGIMSMAATTQYWDTMQSINDPDDYNRTSLTGRKAIWERARYHMAQYPILGVGITNFPVAESRHPIIVASIERGRGFKYLQAHSMWYQVGVETGVPGLLFFASLFALSTLYLRRLVKLARASPNSPHLREAGGYASALMGSLVAIVVAGSLLSNAYWAMVWGMFGLIIGLLKVLRFEGIDVAGNSRGRSAHAANRQPGPAWRRGSRYPNGRRIPAAQIS